MEIQIMSCCCHPPALTLNVRQPGHRMGLTVPVGHTLHETITVTPECRCIQTFLGPAVRCETRVFSIHDRHKTKTYCQQTDTTFYVHCPLSANLAGVHASRAMPVIHQQLKTVQGLPAACVLHVGKKGSIETVTRNLNDLQIPVSHQDRVPFHLLLEIAAGQGTELGRTWEEIRHIYEGLDSTKVGLCIDTQHAFASGMCSFQTEEDVVKLFDMANSIAPKGISMIHLNDSAKPFGSRVDRHAPLRSGYIWNQSDEGLRALIRRTREYGMDLISETPDPLSDVDLINSYVYDE